MRKYSTHKSFPHAGIKRMQFLYRTQKIDVFFVEKYQRSYTHVLTYSKYEYLRAF